MTIDLRGGAASAPLSAAPPRVLIAVTGVSPGCGSSMVATTIADAAAALTTTDGHPVSVALLYPCDDVDAQDVKTGATDMQPAGEGIVAGRRESGARFVMPEFGFPAPPDQATWFEACGYPEIVVVDVASDDISTWMGSAAERTAAVYVARPSIPSIRNLDAFISPDATYRSAVAVTAATSDTPELVGLLAGSAAEQVTATAYFPLDHDLALTGVPASLPAAQLAAARDLLTRLDVLEGAPA